MNAEVPTVNIDQPLEDVVELINEYGISYVPIINDNHNVLGVVTRASLVEVMADRYLD